MIRGIAVALAATLLAGCAPGTELQDFGQVQVDVDTPELRAQKAAAGVEPCANPTTAPHELGDAGLPDVTLPCLGGGEEVDLARLRGPLVITFWGSYCKPCRRELPFFQRFAETYAGRVGVIGIDYNDTQPGYALDMIARAGATFPLLADTTTAIGEAGMRVINLPTLAFVDADGRLTTWSAEDGASFRALEIKTYDELEQLAREHLGAAALAPQKKARP